MGICIIIRMTGLMTSPPKLVTGPNFDHGKCGGWDSPMFDPTKKHIKRVFFPWSLCPNIATWYPLENQHATPRIGAVNCKLSLTQSKIAGS